MNTNKSVELLERWRGVNPQTVQRIQRATTSYLATTLNHIESRGPNQTNQDRKVARLIRNELGRRH